MIGRLVISLACVAMTLSSTASAQVRVEPGSEPQQMPGTPVPEFQAPRRFPRPARPVNPPANRFGVAVPNAPAQTTPGQAPAQGRPPAAGPRAPMLGAFVAPPGLSEPIENLLSDLGYQDAKTLPLTPTTTFEIAYLCYADGRYSDAAAFAAHGLRMCNDARLHLIKGVCQLHLGKARDAEATAADFRSALSAQQTYGIEVASERINDPWAVRFAQVVEYQATGR